MVAVEPAGTVTSFVLRLPFVVCVWNARTPLFVANAKVVASFVKAVLVYVTTLVALKVVLITNWGLLPQSNPTKDGMFAEALLKAVMTLLVVKATGFSPVWLVLLLIGAFEYT